MSKIFIATPALDGKVYTQYALALAETLITLRNEGVGAQVCIPTTGSLLVAERNRLVKTFMESDCTHMLCIDADLGWPAAALPAMLKHDKEMVVGCYPMRGSADPKYIFRGVMIEEGKLLVQDNLIKAQYVPAGFMLLKRSVIEKMHAKFPELYYEPKIKFKENERDSGYCLFGVEVWEGEFWGEDYVFCRRAREAGVDIWIDPLIEFNHAGTIGALAKALSNKKPEEAKKPEGEVCG
jgi:hypothetical protein